MADEKICKSILVKDSAIARISYVQNTNMIPLKFIVEDFTVPTGAIASLIVKKPSGLVAIQNGTLNVSDNSVTVEPTAQMFAESGDHQMQLQISTSGKVLYSYLIQAAVEPCLVTEDMIESTNDFSGLAKIVQDAVSVAYAAIADYCEDNGIVTGASPEQVSQIEALIADMDDIRSGISGGTFDDWKEAGE